MSRLLYLRRGIAEERVLYLKPDDEKDASLFRDTETNVELEVVERLPLVEWFANNYKSFGASLEFVTDKSQEGSQFVKGFGGVGGASPWLAARVGGSRVCVGRVRLTPRIVSCLQASCVGRLISWSWLSTRTRTMGGKSVACGSCCVELA